MTAFQVYAFCEGVWATPAWMMAVDLTPRPIDPHKLRANIPKDVNVAAGVGPLIPGSSLNG